MTAPLDSNRLDDGHAFRGDDESYGSSRACHDCGWSWDLHELRDLRAELADLRAGLRSSAIMVALAAVASGAAIALHWLP